MKTLLHNSIYLELSNILSEIITEKYKIDVTQKDIYDSFGPPPNLKMGHLAFPCFGLAKLCRQSPIKIADSICQKLTKPENSYIKSAASNGPYLNFFLNLEKIGHNIIEEILNGSFFDKNLVESPPHCIIEYSQPNTHKDLHVGHMRNLSLGNSLAKLYKFTGHSVYSVTYPGDVGTHVAKCLWFLKNRCRNKIPSEKKGAWLGKIYTQANTILEEERGTPQEEKNRLALTKILKELENGSGDYFDLWKETRE